MAYLKPGYSIDQITILEKKTEGWLCLCSCGRQCLKASHSLYEGKLRQSLSCGCKNPQYFKRDLNPLWTGHGLISGRFWKRIENNAINRDWIFTITKEQAWQIFQEQEGICSLSGEQLSWAESTYDYMNQTASLDRIDPQIGYTINNIRWIHKEINEMKWNLDDTQFLQYINMILNPLEHQGTALSCIVRPHKHAPMRYGNITGDLWSRIKRNALHRNLEFTINIQEAWDLFMQQRGYCALTGLEITPDGQRPTASFDRINNNQGYVLHNCQWIHKDINTKIKRSLDEKMVKSWCIKIQSYAEKNYASRSNKNSL